MNWKTKSLMLIIAMLMVFSLPVKSSHPVLQESSVRSDIHTDKDSLENELSPSSSLDYDHDALDAVLSEKLTEYGEHGQFDQIYQPCIMSTYHAVYTLYTIGKLSTISKNDTINFIMGYYNESTGLFMDEYALRTLDLDHYDILPLSTYLQANCYAVLTLDIYGELDRINPSKMINFIWSCYYQGGFLGKPYVPGLFEIEKSYFRSLDNLYYAVQVLDILSHHDWSAYHVQRLEICDYIRSIQTPEGFFLTGGTPIYIMRSSQIFSWYALETLRLFEEENTIRKEDFLNYIIDCGSEIPSTFNMNYDFYPTGFDITGTVFGIYHADFLEYTGYDREQALDYVLSNRNHLGLWRASSLFNAYDLISTFHIIRILHKINELPRLQENDINSIANGISLYQNQEGFAPVDHSIFTTNFLYTIASSFSLLGRNTELDPSFFSDFLNDAAFISPASRYEYETIGCSNMSDLYLKLSQVRPIEYWGSYIHKTYFDRRDIYGVENTYYGLECLRALNLFDEFFLSHDPYKYISAIQDAQFLVDPANLSHGGFYKNVWKMEYETAIGPLCIDRFVHYDCSYFAVKQMEILGEYTDQLDVRTLIEDPIALRDYILRNFIETDSQFYFNNTYPAPAEFLMERTYMGIYVLEVLNEFSINPAKVANFIQEFIDYDNLKNVYYAFRIVELLDLDFPFDNERTQMLISQLYNPSLREFYESTDARYVNQRALYWVCYLAKHSPCSFSLQYDECVEVGGTLETTLQIENMVFSRYDDNFYAEILGVDIGLTSFFRNSGCIFTGLVNIPVDLNCFPSCSGTFRLYQSGNLVGQTVININTEVKVKMGTIKVRMLESTNEIAFNLSYVRGTTLAETSDATVALDIFRDDELVKSEVMQANHFGSYSEYFVYYSVEEVNRYKFDVTLYNEFHPEGLMIYNMSYEEATDPENGDGSIEIVVPERDEMPVHIDAFSMGALITAGSVGALGMGMVVAKRRKRRRIVEEGFRAPIYRKNGENPLLFGADAPFTDNSETAIVSEFAEGFGEGYFEESREAGEIPLPTPPPKIQNVIEVEGINTPEEPLFPSARNKIRNICEYARKRREEKIREKNEDMLVSDITSMVRVVKYILFVVGLLLCAVPIVLFPTFFTPLLRVGTYMFLLLGIILILWTDDKLKGAYFVIAGAFFYVMADYVINSPMIQAIKIF